MQFYFNDTVASLISNFVMLPKRVDIAQLSSRHKIQRPELHIILYVVSMRLYLLIQYAIIRKKCNFREVALFAFQRFLNFFPTGDPKGACRVNKNFQNKPLILALEGNRALCNHSYTYSLILPILNYFFPNFQPTVPYQNLLKTHVEVSKVRYLLDWN